MDLKDFKLAITQLAEERGISEKQVMETIEAALAAAYKRDYGSRGQKITAELDRKTGESKFWQVKQVVDESMLLSEEELEKLKSLPVESGEEKDEEPIEGKKVRFNPERHIMIDEAKKMSPDIKVGEELKIPLETKRDYGRIAAQTAKQVILQRVKEVERETVFEDFQAKEGEVISGIVQRVEPNNVYFDIGKISGILPREEQIPGEFYKLGQRFKLYILKVEKSPKGALVFLSRAFPKFISKLFEVEVPEIPAGQVVIKAIAREAGSRAKIAVQSTAEGIDPIGSAVGQRGTRVLAVINELGGEKIDIIQYDEAPARFITNALSPAKVLEVKIMPKNKAICIVPEDQLSLAIGRDGQNVRLAAKLTGWKIDVSSPRPAADIARRQGKPQGDIVLSSPRPAADPVVQQVDNGASIAAAIAEASPKEEETEKPGQAKKTKKESKKEKAKKETKEAKETKEIKTTKVADAAKKESSSADVIEDKKNGNKNKKSPKIKN